MATLFTLVVVTSLLTFRSPRLERAVEGEPTRPPRRHGHCGNTSLFYAGPDRNALNPMIDPDVRASVIADLTARLRPVCAQWPDDLFNAMVDRLADITVKYDGLASLGSYDRRSTERLVSELKDALERNQAARGGDPESRSG